MQRIPQSIWLVTILVAVLLGLWPGIAIGQPHWIFFGALFGWFSIPLELSALLTRTTADNPVFWLQVLAACGYPLAMFGYSACAYWTIRSTRSTHAGLAVTAVAALVSTFASIPAAIVTMSVIQHVNFFRMLSSYPMALPLHLPILINLLVSAVFGWLIAMGLTKRGRSNDTPALV